MRVAGAARRPGRFCKAKKRQKPKFVAFSGGPDAAVPVAAGAAIISSLQMAMQVPAACLNAVQAAQAAQRLAITNDAHEVHHLPMVPCLLTAALCCSVGFIV